MPYHRQGRDSITKASYSIHLITDGLNREKEQAQRFSLDEPEDIGFPACQRHDRAMYLPTNARPQGVGLGMDEVLHNAVLRGLNAATNRNHSCGARFVSGETRAIIATKVDRVGVSEEKPDNTLMSSARCIAFSEKAGECSFFLFSPSANG